MRKWNFSAGPAAIPEAVLKEAQSEMLEWQDSGMSVMEMSHRSSDYITCKSSATNLIDLLDIPSDYQVLFLQGATLQFSDSNEFLHQKVADYAQLEVGLKSYQGSIKNNRNVVTSSESSNLIM